MRLAELQAVVHETLRHERGLDEGALALGVPSRRLTIYRDFVTGHITRVLAKVYPYTRALLGDRWDALAFAFYKDAPAAERELNACVAPFPEWLDRQDVAPFLPTLAQVEWELFAAYANEAEVVADTLTVNPTLAALATRWAIIPWLVAHPDPAHVSPTTPAPAPIAQTALVFRRAHTHALAFHVATDDLLFALKIVSEHIAPTDAAALTGLPIDVVNAALQQAIDIGLVLQGPPEIHK